MPIAHSQFPIEQRQPGDERAFPMGNRQLEIGNRPTAFTLVELMISLAMVLILILGINFVFRSATDAVGAGEALNSINYDAQSTQPVLFNDLHNASKNPPCFIISSQFVTQFINADDAKTSSDPDRDPHRQRGQLRRNNANPAIAPTLQSTSFPPRSLAPAITAADLLKFFAHGNYHRRSGNDGTYIGSESSNDAFIEFGHAALPTNDLSDFYGPSSLPNNRFGSTSMDYPQPASRASAHTPPIGSSPAESPS